MYETMGMKLIRAVIVSYLTAAAAVLILSWALYVMQWQAAGSIWAVRIVYFLSCLAGGVTAGKTFRERRLLWGTLTGAVYGAVLLLVSFLAGGMEAAVFGKMFFVMLICLAGGALGSIIS